MQRSQSLGARCPAGRLAARLRYGLAPVVLCLIPALAQAQANSPGGIATTPLPSMPAPAAPGANPGATAGGGWGIGSALPGIFDQLAVTGDLSELYNTNANGAATGGTSDFDTRAAIGISATTATAHFNAQFAYQLSADYFAQESSQILITNRLTANLQDELVPDHLIIQAQAYAAPVSVSGIANVAGPDGVLPPGANGDYLSSYGFSVQPDFFFKLGHFLRSDLLPSYSGVYYGRQAGAPDPTLGIPLASSFNTLGATERITSGDLFNRLQWGLFASYSELGQSGSNLTQRSGTGELSYAIDHGISLVVDAGYQSVTAHTPFNNPLTGPTLMAGMRFDLAKLTGEFRLGEQYHSFSGTGHLSYQATPRLLITLDAQDTVNTPGAGALQSPEQLLAGLLSGIASGQIQIPPGGLTYGQLGALGLENGIARLRDDFLTASYGGDEYTFSGSLYYTQQNTVSTILAGQNGNLQIIGVMADLRHQFTLDLSGALSVGVHDDTLLVGSAVGTNYQARADYSLNASTQLYFDIGYYGRDSGATLAASNPNGGDVSSVYLQLGIHHQFL